VTVFVTLYKGESLDDAEVLAVSTQRDVVQAFIDELRRQALPDVSPYAPPGLSVVVGDGGLDEIDD
jgi:hypothetical protein